MKNIVSTSVFLISSFFSAGIFSQTEDQQKMLGLPGDNLNLYAVLTLFQKSKTIQDFQRALNEQKTGINNLDLDLDKKVDFIKVVTKREDSSFTFILQDAVSKTETQDVAVILVDKDKDGKVTLQIVGDEDLYGKDYVIEPKPAGSINDAVTPNPAYTGPDPVTVTAPATTVVAVESAPIIQYVYSPGYVPYTPPYYYGYYPPYFAAFTVMALGIYWHNNFYFHGGYYGGHFGGGNTVIINNRNHYSNYHNNKMRSSTVARNNAGGRYNNRPSSGLGNRPSTLPGNGINRPSSGLSRPSGAGLNRPSTLPSTSNSFQSRQNNRLPGGHASSPGFSQGRTRSGAGGFSGGGGMRGGGGGRRR